MAKTTPPFAVPSSFVSAIPVTPTAASRRGAAERADAQGRERLDRGRGGCRAGHHADEERANVEGQMGCGGA